VKNTWRLLNDKKIERIAIKVFGYSQINHEVFIVTKALPANVGAALETNTRICRLNELTPREWAQIRKLQGRRAVLYLRLRYGSADTYILLSYVGEEPAHIEWIVPASKIRGRYPFVTKDSYSIISCLTAHSFRGLGIYPSQIRRVVESDIPARMFWIWTASTNTPSLKGIRKAGGAKVGELVQKKWFWGCISHIEYLPKGSKSEWQKMDYVLKEWGK